MDSSSNSSKSEPLFNVHSIKLSTKAEGPYNRCCIWFQGCNIHCPLCCNKDLIPLIPQHLVSMSKLLEIINGAQKRYQIEGVTLSGGEPSLQQGLSLLNKKIHEMGLGIIMFSGKYKEQLDPTLVKTVDLLLDGPYEYKKHDENRFLIGSTNKRITPITDRYKDKLDYFNHSISYEEVEVSDSIFINGD